VSRTTGAGLPARWAPFGGGGAERAPGPAGRPWNAVGRSRCGRGRSRSRPAPSQKRQEGTGAGHHPPPGSGNSRSPPSPAWKGTVTSVMSWPPCVAYEPATIPKLGEFVVNSTSRVARCGRMRGHGRRTGRALLREVLARDRVVWGPRERFAGGAARVCGVARRRTAAGGHGPAYEPLASRGPIWSTRPAWSGTPELAPTLVRHDARPSDPAHLAVGLGRIEAAPARARTLLVVSPEGPGDPLLERVHDGPPGRGGPSSPLGSEDRELASLAHESLAVPEGDGPGPGQPCSIW